MTILRLSRTAAVWLAWLLTLCAFPAPGQAQIVNVLGWNDYIDPDVIADFTEETGIEVTYDSYNSDAALERRLKAGKETFDVVIVSGPALSKQIAAGVYQKLDENRLPNRKYLWPEIMQLLSAYDIGNRFAVNYMWFTLGISYNAEKIRSNVEAVASRRASARSLASPPFDSWSVLFKPDSLRKFSNCGVGVVDDREYLLAIARRYLWSDWKSAAGLSHETDLKRAGDMLGAVLRDVKKLDASNFVAALANGEICLAVGYSLDGFRARDQAREANNGAEINYVLPREGAPVLMDNLAIPKAAPHVAEAYRFIDFLLRPEIAARNTDFTHAANGIFASKPLVDKSISGNKSVYPDAAVVERLFVPEQTYARTRDAFLREWVRMK
ncbi:extracellular solute-binding protein [Methylocystis echinoides]|jgi:putrescine transport system substrate-binding protein|uniref:extracellular solute-binding protein n=1 Tax=Methylocystis echinoides TaxID=29468 RepID=UPI00343CC027